MCGERERERAWVNCARVIAIQLVCERVRVSNKESKRERVCDNVRGRREETRRRKFDMKTERMKWMLEKKS